jgi:hypothetical protein
MSKWSRKTSKMSNFTYPTRQNGVKMELKKRQIQVQSVKLNII